MPPALWPTPQPIIQRAQSARYTGKPRRMACLCLSPVVKSRGFAWFRPWHRQQIVGLLFDCRFSFTISLRGFHMISARYLRKWRGFLLCDFNFIMDFNRF